MKSFFWFFLICAIHIPALAERKHAQDSMWLFSIDGKKRTLQDLHAAYSGFQILIKEQLQQQLGQFIPDSQFRAWLEKPQLAPGQLSNYLENFSEAAFATQYQDLELVVAEADKSSFSQRPEIRKKLEALQKYYLANLYIFDQLATDTIVPTAAEISAQVTKLKDSGAAQGLSDAELRQRASSQVVLLKAQERQKALMIRLRSEHAIKINEGIDIKKMLENEVR